MIKKKKKNVQRRFSQHRILREERIISLKYGQLGQWIGAPFLHIDLQKYPKAESDSVPQIQFPVHPISLTGKDSLWNIAKVGCVVTKCKDNEVSFTQDITLTY